MKKIIAGMQAELKTTIYDGSRVFTKGTRGTINSKSNITNIIGFLTDDDKQIYINASNVKEMKGGE